MAPTKDFAGVQQSNKKFLCTYDDCEKAYSSLAHLIRHEDIHSGKIYRCEKCLATFKSQYAQKRHIDNIHLKKMPKKYKCDYCEEEFSKKSWLNRHIFKHTGEKPYKCTVENCDAEFLVPNKLRRHLKMHEGYICPKENCNEKFAKWTEVRRHVKLVHPKVYKCPECEQGFSRSNNLRCHMVLHRSDRQVFLCPEDGCGRFYSTNSNLIYHIKNYHEQRPFHCTIGRCFRAFKSQEDLDTHLTIHSPSRRLKKKKKKSKPKATFAAELAGLVPKKWQVDVLKGADIKSAEVKSPDAKSPECSSVSVSMENSSELQFENVAGNEKDILSSAVINCDKVCCLNSDEERNNNILSLNDDDSDCIQNDDIQTLLNTIKERNGFETKSATHETKCISLKA